MRPRLFLFTALLCLAGLTQRSAAMNSLELELEALEGPGWQARGIRARVLPAGQAVNLQLRLRELRLPGALGPLHDVQVSCPAARLSPAYFCPDGRVRAVSATLGTVQGAFSGRFLAADAAGRGTFHLLVNQGNRLDFTVTLQAQRWQVQGTGLLADLRHWRRTLPAWSVAVPQKSPLRLRFAADYRADRASGQAQVQGQSRHGDAVELALAWQGRRWQAQGKAQLADLAFWQPLLPAWPAGWSAGGRLALAFDGQGRQWRELQRLAVQAALRDGSFSDPSGLRAGDKLQATAQVLIRQAGPGLWRQDGTLAWQGGELLFNPWYGQVQQGPVQLASSGWLRPAQRTLELEDSRLQWPGIGAVALRGRLPLTSPLDGDLRLSGENLDVKTLYEQMLKPFLKDKPLLADLDSSGRLGFAVHLQARQAAALRLALDEVSLKDRAGRLRVERLSGQADWRRDGQVHPAVLGWQGLEFYRLPFGPARLQGTLRDHAFQLSQPTAVPFLDGQLWLNRLEGQGFGNDGEWRLGMALTPVSMEALTRRLDWPVFGGTLSAVVPELRYRAGDVQVGGTMRVEAFDGQLLVRNLRLQDLFGQVPVLLADVDLRDLNLEKITQAFDFGRITGILAGNVRHLRLEDWEPAQFVAEFRNVPTPGVRQRISQRAVENLTRLGGGGATAAIQRSFLRFFNEFSYADLGMKISLSGYKAEVDGVVPARQGFYILRGRGLPRVDIIGYNRTVDWRDFVARVQEAVAKGGATIQR